MTETEIEAENRVDEEDDIETLRGSRFSFNEKFTGRTGGALPEKEVAKYAKLRDLNEVPQEWRGAVYKYYQTRLKSMIYEAMQEKGREYRKASYDARTGRWEIDYNFVKTAKIIGVTMSGMAKYRGLLQSLEPRIVLIEEAAEALEAYVTVACMPSVQRLLLVGDHQQLRGHCHVSDLEQSPFFLDISLFERLVRNHVEFTQLTCQRRMRPEICSTLAPLYLQLTNHPSVEGRELIAGMGSVSSYFFSHSRSETSDSTMSKINVAEAEMIARFVAYLIQQGNDAHSITVLTFYNGQRKLILRLLRTDPQLAGRRFNVATVDSYQGEENEIVILSLVRSNTNNTIGFLVSLTIIYRSKLISRMWKIAFASPFLELDGDSISLETLNIYADCRCSGTRSASSWRVCLPRKLKIIRNRGPLSDELATTYPCTVIRMQRLIMFGVPTTSKRHVDVMAHKR